MKLFTTTTCSGCEQVKRFIDEKGLLFSSKTPLEIFNIEEVDGLTEWTFLGIKAQTAPILVEGEGHPYIVTAGTDNIIIRLGEIYVDTKR